MPSTSKTVGIVLHNQKMCVCINKKNTTSFCTPTKLIFTTLTNFYLNIPKKILFYFRCTVKKEGPNKGKLFYVCAKAKPCNFFQWVDDVDVARHTGLNEDNSLPQCPLQTDSVKCNCGIAASS